MVIPVITGISAREWPDVVNMLIGMAASGIVGFGLMLLGRPADKSGVTWAEGMVVSALSWVVGSLVAAIPYILSGHWLSYLDSVFDVMSGLTTTGLVLVQDMEHLSDTINMWRHLLTYIGGQGIVVLALCFLMKGLSGAYKIYVGEAKDERLQPHVTHTARAIWLVSVVYLAIGTIALGIEGIRLGQAPVRAFLHGSWMFMSAWSTGGFAPMSQNVIYYHSLAYEIITLVFMLIGSWNFNLHWAVWTGNLKEMYRNLEIRTFFITTTILGGLAVLDLGRRGVYKGDVSLFRRGIYMILSAHTTTGTASIYARQLALEWGPLALFAITIAMLFGGSASSTAGGFKAVRIGLVFKGVVQDVRKLLFPERAVVVTRFHMGQDNILEDRHVRAAATIIFLYVVVWILVTCATTAAGYDLPSSMFEAASVMGNTGLSAGVTNPAMPTYLKVVYYLGMWLGRMEFLSAFVMVSYFIKKLRRV
jgi:trk system potassium uptake protein TrkH